MLTNSVGDDKLVDAIDRPNQSSVTTLVVDGSPSCEVIESGRANAGTYRAD